MWVYFFNPAAQLRTTVMGGPGCHACQRATPQGIGTVASAGDAPYNEGSNSGSVAGAIALPEGPRFGAPEGR